MRESKEVLVLALAAVVAVAAAQTQNIRVVVAVMWRRWLLMMAMVARAAHEYVVAQVDW